MPYLFSIILPTFNNLPELENCLKGFENQTLTDFKLLICVDGSTDGTAEYLHRYKPKFKFKVLFHNDGKNHGRNAARNLAIDHLDSEYVVFIDSDLVPQTQYLQSHYEVLKNEDSVSIGDIRWTNADTNIWARYQMSRGKNQFTDLDEIPYYYFCIGNSAMETGKFREIDGFDANLVTYGGNDNEFSFRLQKRINLRFVFNKGALAKGEMNKDLTGALEQLREFGSGNLPYLKKKYPDFPNIFNIQFLRKNNWYHRALWSDPLEKFLSLFRPVLSEQLNLKFVHYLTAKYIRKGFLEQK